MNYVIGQRVIVLDSIYEPADDHSPGGYLCRKGEVLVIRDIYEEARHFPLKVSHPHITDRTFGVRENEVKRCPALMPMPIHFTSRSFMAVVLMMEASARKMPSHLRDYMYWYESGYCLDAPEEIPAGGCVGVIVPDEAGVSEREAIAEQIISNREDYNETQGT